MQLVGGIPDKSVRQRQTDFHPKFYFLSCLPTQYRPHMRLGQAYNTVITTTFLSIIHLSLLIIQSLDNPKFSHFLYPRGFSSNMPNIILICPTFRSDRKSTRLNSSHVAISY